MSLSRFRDVNKFFADWNTNWFVTPLGEHPLANRHVEAVQFARGETRIQYKENLLGWSIPKPFPSATFYFFTATTLTICQKERFLEMRHTNGFFFSFYGNFLIIETMAAPGNPAPTGTTQTSSRAAPTNPHRAPRSTFLCARCCYRPGLPAEAQERTTPPTAKEATQRSRTPE